MTVLPILRCPEDPAQDGPKATRDIPDEFGFKRWSNAQPWNRFHAMMPACPEQPW